MFVASYRNTERSISERASVPVIVRQLHDRLLSEHEAHRPIEPEPRAGIPVVHRPLSPFQRLERRALRLWNLSRAELRSNRRNRTVVLARQFIMYWTARSTTYSLPQIGRLLGGRDHTTVLHGKRAYVEKRAKMGRALRSL